MTDLLEYNSTRKKLLIPEYGRNIQKMAEYCVSISNREERTKMAQIVVDVMALIHNVNTENNAELHHKLWDHLYIISDFKLDVDSPFPKPEEKSLVFQPEKPAYNTEEPLGYRNYGKNIKHLIQAVADIPDEKERKKLALLLANHMKKAYLTWNRDIIPDELIIDQMSRFSNGKLTLPPNTVLMGASDVYALNSKGDAKGASKKQVRKKKP